MADVRVVELLRAAVESLQDADLRLAHNVEPAREAVHRELVQAATCVGRALHLLGERE